MAGLLGRAMLLYFITEKPDGNSKMDEKFVKVDGINTRFSVNGGGPAVVLIHGLGEFKESWLLNMVAPGEKYTVYCLDLPGHGLSDYCAQDYTVGFFAKFVLDFMKELGIPHASLAGRSMGCHICLAAAIDASDRVDRLVLADSWSFNPTAPLGYRLAALPVLGRLSLGPPALVNKTTVALATRRQFYNRSEIPAAWLEAAVKHLKRPHRNEMLQKLIRNNIASNRENYLVKLQSKLADLKKPVLIVHGLQDRVINVEHAHAISKSIPGATLKIIDRCGHNPQLEKPQEFNRLVVDFLSS
ncbi:MAG TPA: alpha/beta fold hydrolase [Dehalococcoidales bacterium]|nr:alpha/beta fold hydrolase [Dehalococcoidales bacterium]